MLRAKIGFAMIVMSNAVALPSCGGAPSVSSTASDGGTYDDATGSQTMEGGAAVTLAVASPECVTLATAMCERLNTCSPETFAAYEGTPRCIRDLTFECPLGRPYSLATPADVTTCASAYAALPCSDVIERNIPPSCDHVMRGTEDEGAHCAIHADCSSGHCIGIDYACGFCETVPVAPGARCGFNDHLCGPHLSCGVDLICWPTGGAGAPCGAPGQGDCETDLQCVAGSCAPRPEAGAPCEVNVFPFISSCPARFSCNAVSRTCTPWQVVDQGPCGIDKASGNWLVCRPGNVCRPTKETMVTRDTGLCTPLREEGQPCGEDWFLPDIGEIPVPATPCRRPAICFQGQCVVAYTCP